MMKRIFTGKDMALILICGFAVVVAVNFYMASVAIGGFGGVVVENSYVASQKFNGWLDEAEKSRALGWEVEAVRDESGYVIVEAANVPGEARVEAVGRAHVGRREHAGVVDQDVDALVRAGDGVRERRVWRQQHGLRAGVVLRLAQEVGGDPVGGHRGGDRSAAAAPGRIRGLFPPGPGISR